MKLRPSIQLQDLLAAAFWRKDLFGIWTIYLIARNKVFLVGNKVPNVYIVHVMVCCFFIALVKGAKSCQLEGEILLGGLGKKEVTP